MLGPLFVLFSVAPWAVAADTPFKTIDLPALPTWYDESKLPQGKPMVAPAYMVDNTQNTHGAAPDKGSMNGPVFTLPESESVLVHQNSSSLRKSRRSDDFWMDGITHGQMPFAPDGYQFYRNIKDFGAVGDGVTDDTEAINRAASWYSTTDSTLRCGESCGSTSVLGALVYFPSGTYVVSTPIIQYYYTQFVGDSNSRPVIQGSENFTGIALIDTDVYIPEGSGDEWYINQNQFYRQIRNFVFDLTLMNFTNYDNGQEYVPTGIHWQVSQATSLQNLYFNMPTSGTETTTAVGIFMENGSGGFLSDLVFYGGNIGFRAGSQQFTARNLHFTSCLTAIQIIWDWGFTWSNIFVYSCWVAIDCTSIGGEHSQGTGSLTVLDSAFNGVPYPITLRNGGPYPSIVLDNVAVTNSADIVLVSGGDTILAGSTGEEYFESWAMGSVVDSTSTNTPYSFTGFLTVPNKPEALLNSSGSWYGRSRPQYESYSASDFIIATDHDISNDGTGDQSSAINSLLSGNVGSPIFFPAGVYQVQSTVKVPVGTIMVGEGWSQIMAEGEYFQDASSPQVMVQVGELGDSGVVEMTDFMFTVKGATAGAILVEWNVAESEQGSAGMWDCHFRVGGAYGTNLTLDECPAEIGAVNTDCMAASMLMHLTSESSGYFENVWGWVADHYLDKAPEGNTTTSTNINIFAARGWLVESAGPTWFYGTAVEHNVLYQYNFVNAKNIFLTHIQTESPYYQPSPDATQVFDTMGDFTGDPSFDNCETGSSCADSWALRVIESSDIIIYTAGLYSWFDKYDESCIDDESCQLSLVDTSYSEGLWLYNLFTKGAEELVSPEGGIPPLLQSATNQSGYVSEISAWLVLSDTGSDIGSDKGTGGGADEDDGSGVVYIGNTIYLEPSPTVACEPPCTLVWAPSPINSQSTISFSPTVTTITGGGSTVTTTLTPSPVTTSLIPFYPLTIGEGQTSTTFALTSSLQPSPTVVTLGGVGVTVNFPATSAPAEEASPTQSGADETSTTSSTILGYYTLPTTVYTTDGKTQTFSEDQITKLSTITTTTTITTSWTEVSSSGSKTTSSTTVVPIIVAPGGFYWSPVPKPGIDIPSIPTVPPVPTAPCFKFLDIFSIDCPPDKSKPTSHYTKGKASPTCTASCGTITDTASESKSTSTCATETQTTCFPTAGTTSCRTYVGCECQTKTVTDYWVSCASSSCTTTSSEVVSGCYVTATATTTGSYCLAPDYDESLQDVGDTQSVSAADIITGTATVTRPESVEIGTVFYTPTGGVITKDGSTITVVSVTVETVITIDGTAATVFPETTTTEYEYNYSTMGFSGTPSDPRSTAAATTSDNTTPTTTSTSTTSTVEPSRYVYIEYAETDQYLNLVEIIEKNWVVYSASGTYNACDVKTLATKTAKGVTGGSSQGYPAATMTFEAFGTKSCVYEGPSTTAPGTLSCPGAGDITCITDPQFGEKLTCDAGNVQGETYPDVRCYW